jgi:two component regulator with propeller domain
MRVPIPRLARILAGACLLAAFPAEAAVDRAWQTHLRAKDFTDLLVTDDAVWCATAEAGLLHFDRVTHRFDAITREPGSIASNHITTLALDRRGRLWVGTFESGVSRLAADGTSWVLVNAFDGLPVDSVTTITMAGDTLWIGTRGGIALWNGRQVQGSLPDGNTVSFDTTFVNPAITGVVQLADTLWLSTPRGIGFARTSTNLSDWRPANAGLGTLAVERLASDGQSLFALAAQTVYAWSPEVLAWSPVPGLTNVANNLKEDHGTVLVPTSSGIYRRRAGDASFALIQDSDSPGPVSAALADPEPSVDPTGAMHYAATSQGLWEQPAGPGPWALRTPIAPPGNTYSNLAIDGARLYVVTRTEGAGRWDGSAWTAWPPVYCSACPNTFQRPIELFALLVDRVGLKWVGGWSHEGCQECSALERFDDSIDPPAFTHLWGATDEFRHTLAYGAAADSVGGRWFGMHSYDLDAVEPLGLDWYDSTGTYAGTWGPGVPESVRNGKIRAVTVDKTGRIWIGYAGPSNGGVDHFLERPESGAQYDFRTVVGTTSLDIWGLVAHGDTIWTLTDRDLRRITRTSPRVAQTLQTPAGRPLGPRLIDVAPDGSVFVGSEEGVRWYRRDGSTRDFTTANSPLASDVVHAVVVDRATGVVWFGTAAGLNRFDPGYQPPIPSPHAADTLHVYPNPAQLTGLGVQLRLQGTSSGYTGGIYDLTGRQMHRFVTTAQGQVFWDGRDQDGVMAKPGVYFVRAEGAGRAARARFVLLH